MKKFLSFLLIITLIGCALAAWLLLGSATVFSEKRQYLYINTGHADKGSVMETIKEKNIVKYPAAFELLASKMDLWKRIKPGRYEIKNGESLVNIIRMLRNNKQVPVKLVINKVRTNQDLAKLIGKNFESGIEAALDFVVSSESLSNLGVDTNTLMTLVIPDTYSIYWNTSLQKIFQRLKTAQEKFWADKNRLVKAREMGLTPEQVYTIASIVEEETNKHDEKGNIASVYLNRHRIGMALGADPTIKFALKDVSIKRIYNKHLQVVSPYNTYKNKGLPPGPICTPSSISIDAVLNAPSTNYLFFVAKSDFSGYHTFSSNYAEHLQYAKEYQRALDEWMKRKEEKQKDSL